MGEAWIQRGSEEVGWGERDPGKKGSTRQTGNEGKGGDKRETDREIDIDPITFSKEVTDQSVTGQW